MEDFKKYNFPTNIYTPAIFYVGKKYMNFVLNRVKKAHKLWKGKKNLVYIPEVGHEIESPAYLTEIFRELKK